MQTFLIACDPQGSCSAPADVSVAVRLAGECWSRVLDTVWYVRTAASAEELSARFAAIVGSDDGLVIQPVAAEPALLNTVRRWFPATGVAGRVIAMPSRPERLAAA